MLIEHQHPDNRSIMVSVLGVPNAGKSSFINTMLGTDLSVVTSKPQTTRNQYHCVVTVDHTEIIFVDTPGLHSSGQEFNRRMNEQVKDGLSGVDLNLLLIDLTQELAPQLDEIRRNLSKDLGRTWILFTKKDLIKNIDEMDFSGLCETVKNDFPNIEKHFVISSKKEENIHLVTAGICDEAQPGPHLYPGGEISNKNQRFFVTEYIREQAFLLLKDELPHELAVTIDMYDEFVSERKGQMAKISATILVNRPSQRAIVVGSRGSMIKEIGTRARWKIQAMTGCQVHLNLHVKVSPKWFKNNFVLEELGLPRASTSTRVWRKN